MDPEGLWIETAFDVAMLAVGVAEFVQDPSWSNGLGVVADAAFLILPAPNVAAARHIGKGARRAMEPAPFFKPKCFVAGTEVLMHDGSSRPIEQIEPGDRVASRSDEGTQDSPVVEGRVTRVFRSVAQGTLLIRFDGGGTVETTDEHPFYVPGRGFVEAGELRTGDRVAEDDGELSVVGKVERLTEPKEVYNLEVEGTHTYFVRAGDDWLWVHNQCRMPGVYIGTAKDGRPYVGQSGDVFNRIGGSHHKLDPSKPVDFIPMPGSTKREREIIEQQIINKFGGVESDKLANERNPIAVRFWDKLRIKR